MTTLVPGWRWLVITFLAGGCTSLAWSQPCPPDRIFADGYDGVPVQRLVLTFTAQPSTTPVAATIAPAVQVSVTDECSDAIGGKDVQIAIGPNPPNPGVLSGTLDAQSDAASGTASFFDLALDYLGSGYTLVATVSGPGGTFSATSTPFDETRVGDPCLGPDTPACAGACADSDGDGLNDAWEIAGGIDLNGDGVIDAQHDLLLPGADPNVPDIYVEYDWMDYGPLDYPCSSDFECPQYGTNPVGGATCTGPKIASSTAPGSCQQQCSTNLDCTSLGEAEVGDQCVQNICLHTHDPEVVAPGAIQLVVDRFSAHGINLHVLRGQALSHSHVVSFRSLAEMTDGCEGGSLLSGTAGLGDYAESYFDLKSRSFDPKLSVAYHHMIFSHYSGCDSAEHCANDAHTGACPSGTGNCGTVAFGASGVSEINGNDFIVSLGNSINDDEAFLVSPAPGGIPFGKLIVGGTYMHELGHNLGLHHGGGVSSTPDPNSCQPPDCEDECTSPPEPNYKPNYLSVMNYLYEQNGIQNAAAPGGFVPVDTRLDYSVQLLPNAAISDGVSGVLDELGLDETVAGGLTSANSDLFAFTDGKCAGHSAWPTQGPVDWSGKGTYDQTAAQADLNPEANPGATCVAPVDKHRGHVDWGPAPGQSIFRYGFQCTQYYADPASGAQRAATATLDLKAEVRRAVANAPVDGVPGGELTADQARRAHVLYPTAAVRIAIRPGCASAAKPIAVGEPGELTIALMGDEHFDAGSIDPASLRFHGAAALRTAQADIDGDGWSDLLVTFNTADVKLGPTATVAHLTGWLKSSQTFIGEDRVRIVPTMAGEDQACLN